MSTVESTMSFGPFSNNIELESEDFWAEALTFVPGVRVEKYLRKG